MYKAVFVKSFLKEFEKLPKEIKSRCVEAIHRLVDDPYKGTRLHGPLSGYWRYRVGKYRIIYRIDESKKAVIFMEVGHRKNVYFRFG